MQVTNTAQFNGKLPEVGDLYEGKRITAVSFGKNGLNIEVADEQSALLESLRFYAESVDTNAKGEKWGDVYLPNVEHNMTPHQFAGTLAALQAKGLYKTIDGEFFGSVKLA